MVIKSENKFMQFMRRFGVYILAITLIVAMTITLGVVAALRNRGQEVGSKPLEFALPMNEASIIKDYSDTRLQYNPTLERWEAHMAVDMTADDLSVYSVLDGTVLSVEYKYLEGYVVEIEHSDGFVSRYASLSKDVEVQKGDKVAKSQKIGAASSLSASESGYGDHVEFKLMQNGKTVDPNNYLNLQGK